MEKPMTILRVTRREFVAALSNAAAWPILARAQRSSKQRRIGVLIGIGDNLAATARYTAFNLVDCHYPYSARNATAEPSPSLRATATCSPARRSDISSARMNCSLKFLAPTR